MKHFVIAILIFSFLPIAKAFADQNIFLSQQEVPSLFSELAIVEEVNKKINDRLPFFYNFVMLGGYFNMPSARMNKTGTFALGGGKVPPYSIYGANFQIYSHVELAFNYRVYTGVTEGNFGHLGFGDDADRIGNIKFAMNLPGDSYKKVPNFAFGFEDCLGTGRFSSQFFVMTKEFLEQNFEFTLGWGSGRIKGFFGGLAWTPFRKCSYKFLPNLSLLVEYDAIDYAKHKHEHPDGRDVNFRLNGGIVYNVHDIFQFSVSSVRGKDVAAYLTYQYPLGTSNGIFPKLDEAPLYSTPVDTQKLGYLRPEREFAQELAYAFLDQGLDVYTVYISYDEFHRKRLWIKIINNRYWRASDAKRRIEHVLMNLTPSDIASVTTVLEANGIPTHQYTFRNEDLQRFRKHRMNEAELEVLTPMEEATPPPSPYESSLLFHREKSIWTFTARPRLLTFFGSSTGKFKFSLSAIASLEGYLFDEIYYRTLVSYNILSSTSDMGDCDVLNPSQLLNVRTDTINYFKSNTLSLEQAYLQKSWNLSHGFYTRLAFGYFEHAYGGLAAEALYYPVKSDLAVGIEGAVVGKRDYEGLGFMSKIRKFEGRCPVFVGYLGQQYFLNLYYNYRPLQLDTKISVGKFLARDVGARFEAGRYFCNGLRFGLWYTITNGNDKVNGKTYHDKGVMISMPLDFFMKKSSRSFIGYAMAAWLRDVGAVSATGRQLYPTLFEERF